MDELEQDKHTSLSDSLTTVLDAEAGARKALADCEREAIQITEDALALARRIERRAEDRIGRVRSHHSRLAAERKQVLDHQIESLTAEEEGELHESQALKLAVEQLADELLGSQS